MSNIKIEIIKYLLPDLQKIIWKKIFKECMKDLKEKTHLIHDCFKNINEKVANGIFKVREIGGYCYKKVENGHWCLFDHFFDNHVILEEPSNYQQICDYCSSIK